MSAIDLTVLLPVLNEERNLAILLRFLTQKLPALGIQFEIIVIDGGSKDKTADTAKNAGPSVQVIEQQNPGYGEALRLGFEKARGGYILTLDSDLSHNPTLIASLWQARENADFTIASRYIPGGSVKMPFWRLFLSRILNSILPRLLSLPVRDLSSGFRLYRSCVVKGMKLTSTHFEVLEEILIKAFAQGRRIQEIPMRFRPRKRGKSKVRLIEFAVSFLITFQKMWRLRNSIECADYDDRAYDSRIFLQRYWQRKRLSLIQALVPKSGKTLDIGCGSSRILSALPSAIGLDILFHKLRYLRKWKRPLVNGSIWALPFRNQQFDNIVCSEVIEHIAEGEQPFLEMRRILKPGGCLVIGTPDYSHLTWRIIEAIYERAAPGGYAHEHCTHYTFESLKNVLEKTGFRVEESRYICHSEMILKCTLTKS